MSSLEYTPLHELPPLAGLCTFEQAQKPGLSVEECVRRLKRFHWSFKRLHEILVARLTAEPIYELKMAFSLHAHYCAEHAAALRSRVSEMREPPLGLDQSPDHALDVFFDEILGASNTAELLLGVYEKAVPALIRGMLRHQSQTNPLADAPSVRTLKFALLELNEILDYGRKAIAAIVTADQRPDAFEWLQLLDRCLAISGGIDGTDPKLVATPTRHFSEKAYVYDAVPKRDERFPDPYNMGVNAEAFLYDQALPPEPKVLMMFYKRLREIDVPEMMASIITETKGKLWSYYRDMTRQLWDEARHAMMGEVGFLSLQIDWPKTVRVNFTWSFGLNTQLTARERHGVLYFIEQGLMPKTGKRFEWETAVGAHNPLAATFQDFDWADEVLHARVGRDWYVSTFENPKEALEWGDKCWSKVVSGWTEWKNSGLTQHDNWWPRTYQAYCRAAGQDPDPAVLGFNTSYETQRADLKVLSTSG